MYRIEPVAEAQDHEGARIINTSALSLDQALEMGPAGLPLNLV